MESKSFYPEISIRQVGEEFMVVLADGVWENQPHAVQEARKCHAHGIEIAALGFGGADRKFLHDIASCEENALFTNMNQLGESFSPEIERKRHPRNEGG